MNTSAGEWICKGDTSESELERLPPKWLPGLKDHYQSIRAYHTLEPWIDTALNIKSNFDLVKQRYLTVQVQQNQRTPHPTPGPNRYLRDTNMLPPNCSPPPAPRPAPYHPD
ncbi:hypothetical protein BOTBODRAFT_542904 [Botryobasidium botryosum FD-172 SS1]|uniref:Uncharacterized protein n=1 Tax=Botryobasidium botryosum (strain FD-172 SS1) TaxID=930990 RepID=A0A067N184_BOTB1|nr:hypothetical protein BOTBODRAFT_542904 [Botryobasidium botryosum FD-172 SS1]